MSLELDRYLQEKFKTLVKDDSQSFEAFKEDYIKSVRDNPSKDPELMKLLNQDDMYKTLSGLTLSEDSAEAKLLNSIEMDPLSKNYDAKDFHEDLKELARQEAMSLLIEENPSKKYTKEEIEERYKECLQQNLMTTVIAQFGYNDSLTSPRSKSATKKRALEFCEQISLGSNKKVTINRHVAAATIAQKTSFIDKIAQRIGAEGVLNNIREIDSKLEKKYGGYYKFAKTAVVGIAAVGAAGAAATALGFASTAGVAAYSVAMAGKAINKSVKSFNNKKQKGKTSGNWFSYIIKKENRSELVGLAVASAGAGLSGALALDIGLDQVDGQTATKVARGFIASVGVANTWISSQISSRAEKDPVKAKAMRKEANQLAKAGLAMAFATAFTASGCSDGEIVELETENQATESAGQTLSTESPEALNDLKALLKENGMSEKDIKAIIGDGKDIDFASLKEQLEPAGVSPETLDALESQLSTESPEALNDLKALLKENGMSEEDIKAIIGDGKDIDFASLKEQLEPAGVSPETLDALEDKLSPKEVEIELTPEQVAELEEQQSLSAKIHPNTRMAFTLGVDPMECDYSSEEVAEIIKTGKLPDGTELTPEQIERGATFDRSIDTATGKSADFQDLTDNHNERLAAIREAQAQAEAEQVYEAGTEGSGTAHLETEAREAAVASQLLSDNIMDESFTDDGIRVVQTMSEDGQINYQFFDNEGQELAPPKDYFGTPDKQAAYEQAYQDRISGEEFTSQADLTDVRETESGFKYYFDENGSLKMEGSIGYAVDPDIQRDVEGLSRDISENRGSTGTISSAANDMQAKNAYMINEVLQDMEARAANGEVVPHLEAVRDMAERTNAVLGLSVDENGQLVDKDDLTSSDIKKESDGDSIASGNKEVDEAIEELEASDGKVDELNAKKAELGYDAEGNNEMLSELKAKQAESIASGDAKQAALYASQISSIESQAQAIDVEILEASKVEAKLEDEVVKEGINEAGENQRDNQREARKQANDERKGDRDFQKGAEAVAKGDQERAEDLFEKVVKHREDAAVHAQNIENNTSETARIKGAVDDVARGGSNVEAGEGKTPWEALSQEEKKALLRTTTPEEYNKAFSTEAPEVKQSKFNNFMGNVADKVRGTQTKG